MPAGVPALVPCHARGFPGWQKVEQEFSLQLVYRRGRLRKGVMSKNPKNRIVVLVIEDEALILDLMEEVLADLDVPRKKYGVMDLGTFIGTPLSISEALFQLSNVMPYAARSCSLRGRAPWIRAR